jgi:hypothetical protein
VACGEPTPVEEQAGVPAGRVPWTTAPTEFKPWGGDPIPTASHATVDGQAIPLRLPTPGGRTCVVQVEPASVVPSTSPAPVPVVPATRQVDEDGQDTDDPLSPWGRSWELHDDPPFTVER